MTHTRSILDCQWVLQVVTLALGQLQLQAADLRLQLGFKLNAVTSTGLMPCNGSAFTVLQLELEVRVRQSVSML